MSVLLSHAPLLCKATRITCYSCHTAVCTSSRLCHDIHCTLNSARAFQMLTLPWIIVSFYLFIYLFYHVKWINGKGHWRKLAFYWPIIFLSGRRKNTKTCLVRCWQCSDWKTGLLEYEADLLPQRYKYWWSDKFFPPPTSMHVKVKNVGST